VAVCRASLGMQCSDATRVVRILILPIYFVLRWHAEGQTGYQMWVKQDTSTYIHFTLGINILHIRSDFLLQASPIFNNNGSTLYVGSQDHRLYAFDAFTGQQIWQLDTDGCIFFFFFFFFFFLKRQE